MTPVVEATADPVNVMAEPIALEQIIYNLLINALQALEQVAAGDPLKPLEDPPVAGE